MKINYSTKKKNSREVVIGKSIPTIKNHKIAVRRFHKAQAVFKEIASIYGNDETQKLIFDMLNAGYSAHESAEHLKRVLL